MKLFAIVTSLLSVTSRNIINAILFMILLFILRALHRCEIGATYMGLTYIIVYAGGISILFLFVIRRLYPSLPYNNQGHSGFPLAVVFMALLWTGYTNRDVGQQQNIRQPYAPNRIDNIALCLYAPNAVWIIVLAVMFLVAMVGCIVLCLKSSDTA